MFHGEYGLTTAARDHLCYNLPSEKNHECLWNGPSWPFATTQTINAMIASRQNKNSSLKATDISRELLTYANSFIETKQMGQKSIGLMKILIQIQENGFPENFKRPELAHRKRWL